MKKLKLIFTIITGIAISMLASSWTCLRTDGKGKYVNAGTLGKVMIEVLGEERTCQLFYNQQAYSDWEKMYMFFSIDTIGYQKDGHHLISYSFPHVNKKLLEITDEEWEKIIDYIYNNDIRLWHDLKRDNRSEDLSKEFVQNLITECVNLDLVWEERISPFRLPEMKYDSYVEYVQDKKLDPQGFSYFDYYKMLIDEYLNIPLDPTMVEYGFMKKYPIKTIQIKIIQKETKQHYIFK